MNMAYAQEIRSRHENAGCPEAVLLRLSQEKNYCGTKRPCHCMEVMKKNRGSIGFFSPDGVGADGLERRNPVIVAMGDSVTAGHFQWLIPPEKLEKNYQRLLAGDFSAGITEVEEANVLASYPDVFRKKLVAYYHYTCVSVINAGIAGDNLRGMYARHERDIIRHDPDLVLINGSLNWE